MLFIRRYWVAGLVVSMVVIHAAVIGYVRSRIATLNVSETTTIEIGSFHFQTVEDTKTVYRFNLHAIADPTRRHVARERLSDKRLEIIEAAEQLLRQVSKEVLRDPTQTVLRERLMEVILQQVTEPMIQRLVITGWLEAPVAPMGESPGVAKESMASGKRS